jgi:hypothetical protein
MILPSSGMAQNKVGNNDGLSPKRLPILEEALRDHLLNKH